MNRRQFLATAAAATASAAAGASPLIKNIFPSRVLGANERIHTAHIGLGAMGRMNLGAALGHPEVQPVAVCDLWPPHLDYGAEAVASSGITPTKHIYHEEIFDLPDVDAVVISTPDHWHTIPAIQAAQAGLDMYCEKPLATTVREGQAIVKAVRENDVVFQAGTLQRSGDHFKRAVALIQSGHIGEVGHAETWIHMPLPPTGIGTKPDEAPPEGLDWARYLGWTPQVPFNWNRFLANFRWYLDYSGGYMTDWGVHLIDIVLWAMGDAPKLRGVAAAGGKYVLSDDRDTPDTLDVVYDFDTYSLKFCTRAYNGMPPYGTNNHGMDFYGTLGTLRLNRNGFWVIPNGDSACEALTSEGSEQHRAHWQNFVDCVKSRQRPVCDVETVHRTTTLCHLGTAAWVAKARLAWNEDTGRATSGDPEAEARANAFLFRPYENGYTLDAPWLPEQA